jgi:hypothetical protein
VKDQAPKDWVIVGGGLIGSALALYIKSHVTEDFTLVDPYPKPIQQWETWARNCGMTHMRSTASHSLSWDFHGLWAYIKRQGRDPMAEFLPPNKRPSLEDFLRYSGFLCQEYHLLDHWLRGRVQGLLSHGGYWEVNLASGQTLHARRVLLALGGRQSPAIPEVFRQLLNSPGAHRVHFLIGPPLGELPPGRVLVVGGGIAGVQKSLQLSGQGYEVVLLTEGELKPSLYDHDVAFNGPKKREELRKLEGAVLARMVSENKLNGTVPPELIQSLEQGVNEGKIQRIIGLQGAKLCSQGIQLWGQGFSLVVDRIILATGFEEKVPKNPLVEGLVAQGFPQEAGYPQLAEDLSWQEGLQVAGAMAELKLGPGAGNLIGHHLARRRIFSS